MDAQVNFKAQEQAVEGFVNALQELKAMMKSLNDLPITRLKRVEKSIVTPMQEAVGKLAETGTAMVNQFKQIGQKSGEALEVSAKSSITKATTQIKQVLAGHYDALGNFISTASAELKAKTDKATAAALMLDTGVVRQATQQSVQAMSGHYNALGVYVDARSKELQAKAEANQAALFRVQAKLGTLASGDNGVRLQQGAQGSLAELSEYYKKVGQTAEARGRVLAKLGQQATPDTGVRLHVGAQGDLTAMKSHYAELERVANLKAQIKKRIETSDVGFKPAASPRMSLDQKDGQYAEAMAALKAQYSPSASAPKAQATEATQATLRAAAALRDKAKASTEMAGAATKSGGALKVLVNHLTDVHSAARGVASGFGMMWLTWGKLTPLLAGAALSNSLVQTAQRGKEFETVLAGIEYMGGASAGEVRKLSAAALELGANSKYGPIEIAQGLKVLTLAGLDSTESLQALKPMLDFSTVSELPLDKAAESLLGISKAFGYNALEVSVAGDVVAKAAAVSMSSVSDMTEAFKQSSTVAQQFGVTIQDQSVGLAMLAQIGIRGSAAGTALRNMYVELMGSSKKAREVLEKTLNVNIFDNATKAVKPLSTVLTDLAKSLSGKTFEAQTKILNDLGNERGMKMISAGLAGIRDEAKKAGLSTEEFVSQFAKLQKELEDAPGFMATAAIGMSTTTENIMKSVSGSLQSSMIKAFEEMSPYLINFSMSLREVFQSPEFIQGLKDLVRFVGEAAQGFASAVKFVWEYRDAILAAGAGLLALKASTAVMGVMSAATAAAAGTVRTLTAAFLIAGPAGFAGAAGATAMAGAVNLLKVALGPIAIALSAAAAAYYYFSESAGEAAAKQVEEQQRANDELKKALDAKQTMGFESMTKEIERLDLYIKHKGDEKKINEEMKKLSDEAAVNSLNSTNQQILQEAEKEAAVNRVEAATKRVLASEMERDIYNGGKSAKAKIDQLRAEAAELDNMADQIKNGADLRVAAFTYQQQEVSRKAKEAAKIANDLAAARRQPATGPGGYKPDDKKGRESFDTKIRLDAEQVTARYRIEMEVITSGENLKANLLKSLHNNKLIMDGEFAAREIALVESTELRKLEVISRSRAEYEKKHESDIESLESQRLKFIQENSGKKGFDDKYAEYVADLVDKFDDLHAKRETHLQDFDKETKKVNDSAIQRWAEQVNGAAGRLKALSEISKEFWRQEAANLAKQKRADGVEDALRYASPEQAAVIQAQSAAYEQYASQIEELSSSLSKAEDNHAAMTAAINDSLFTMVAEGAKAEDVAKVKELLYTAEKADLDEIIAKREHLAGIKAVQGEMVNIQGDRALTKFKKDEEAQLIKGVADAIETGLFEGGTAGKKKLRDLIVAELRKPISLIIQAVVNPVMGALLGSMGMGSAAAGQVGGSMLGTAVNGYSMYSNLASGAVGAGIFGSSAAYASGLGLSSAAAGSQAAMLAAQTGSFGAAGLAATAQAAGTASTAAASAASAASSTASALAAAAPWLVGGLLVLNALGAFRTTKTVGGGLSGTLGEGDINSYDLNRKSGTLFSGPDYSIANMQKSAWSDMIQNDWKRATTSVVDMAKALNLSTEAANGFTAVLGTDVIHPDTGGMGIKLDDLRGKNLSEQQYAQEVQNRINEAILAGSEELAQKLIGSWTTTTETIAKQVQVFGVEGESTWETVNETVTKSTYTVSEYARSNETALQTLTRLATSLTTVNQAFDVLGLTLQEASLKGADAASAIVDAYGGIDTFGQLFGSFYENYYSEEEKRANSVRQITKELAAAGSELTEADIGKTTKAQFRAITEGIIETKGAADPLAVALMKVAPAFAEVAGAAEATLKALKDTGAGLQADLLEELGRKSEAVALRRKTDIIGMDAAAIAQYDFNNSLRDQIDAVKTAKQVSKDAEAAARARAEAVAQERDGLNRQLLEAIGDTAAIRALEIAALDASNRAIQEHIWAIEDAKSAYEKATDAAQAAYNTLERSVDAERTKLTTTYNAEKDAISARLKAQQVGYQAQITAAQAAADKIRDIASALAAAVNKVKVDSPALNRLAYDAARGVISTRNIDDPRLKAALDAVSGDNKQFYGTFEAYAFDQAVTSANIKSMDTTAQSQLSAAEALINSMKASDTLSQALADAELAALEEKHQEDLAKLQEQLDLGKSQLDALLGIDNSVLSVAAAVAALGGAISAAYAAQAAQMAAIQGAVAASRSVSSGGGGGGGGVENPWEYDPGNTARSRGMVDVAGNAALSNPDTLKALGITNPDSVLGQWQWMASNNAAMYTGEFGLANYLKNTLGIDVLHDANDLIIANRGQGLSSVDTDAAKQLLNGYRSYGNGATNWSWEAFDKALGSNYTTEDFVKVFASMTNADPAAIAKDYASMAASYGTDTSNRYTVTTDPTPTDLGASVKGLTLDLPSTWTSLSGADKIEWFNDNRVMPEVLNAVGIARSDLDWMRDNGYAFDVGINRVPYDMPAFIHEDEAVLPARFNPFNPNATQPLGGSDDPEVVAELKELNRRITALVAHAAATDRKLARVIKNNAITTEAAT